MSSRLASRACLLSTALASVLTLGASAPAMAVVPVNLPNAYIFGGTGGAQDYGTLDLGSSSISTGGNQGYVSTDVNSPYQQQGGLGHNTNYMAGSCGNASGSSTGCREAPDHNNYFVFSLAGIKSPVKAATLVLKEGAVGGSGYYNIYDATALSDQLLKGPKSGNVTGATGATLYQNITTTGAMIGEQSFNENHLQNEFKIDLNPEGLRDLNYDITHGIKYFAIGGTVTTPGFAPASDPSPPPSAPSPLPGVGLLQFLCLLGFLAFAAARARVRS